MAQVVRAALVVITASMAAQVRYREARRILHKLVLVMAVSTPPVLLLTAAQCLWVLEVRAARVRRQRLVTVLAAVVLVGTLALAVRVAMLALPVRVLWPVLAAAAAAGLVIP